MVRKSPSLPTMPTASHPLRVFTLFAVGIIVPSSFLSYLGFRSLKTERMLQTRQAEEQYAAVADLMQRKSADIIRGLSQDWRRTIDTPALRSGDAMAYLQKLLSTQSIGHIPVRQLFLFETAGRM